MKMSEPKTTPKKRRRKVVPKKPAASLTNDELRELPQFATTRKTFPNFPVEKILSIVREGVAHDQEAIRQKKIQKLTEKYIKSLRELGLIGHSFTIHAQRIPGGDVSYKVNACTAPTKETRTVRTRT
jgi:hypothetical protein